MTAEERTQRQARLVEQARAAKLTRRERDVLREIADGGTNEDVAERLCISVHTAKFHVGNAILKLSARSRAHAVALAFRAGLVT